MCDNIEIAPDQVTRYMAEDWLYENYVVMCTAMGPAGYIGLLEPQELLSDTIMLFETGKYKLLYTFIHETDKLLIESNEFYIEQD